jgi:molybdenum cofactor synthesis domain-containing protein
MPGKTAAIVVIGNEILSGKTEETNASFLTKELHQLGVSLRRILCVPDEMAEIGEAVRECSARFDIVITSGGVGPTHDDITMQAIAVAFGGQARRHPELERLMRAHFGEALRERDLRMAEVPEGATLLAGDSLHWPVVVLHNIYILPGIPEIFRRKFGAIRERFRDTPFCLRALYLSQDEASIAASLDQVAAGFPEVEVGSYPRIDEADHRVKITLESKNREAVEQAFRQLLALLPDEAVVRAE